MSIDIFMFYFHHKGMQEDQKEKVGCCYGSGNIFPRGSLDKGKQENYDEREAAAGSIEDTK